MSTDPSSASPSSSSSSLKRRAPHEAPTDVELPAKCTYTLTKHPPPPPPRGPPLSPLHIPNTDYLATSCESKPPSDQGQAHPTARGLSLPAPDYGAQLIDNGFKTPSEEEYFANGVTRHTQGEEQGPIASPADSSHSETVMGPAPLEVRNSLAKHNLLYNDPEARHRGADILAAANAVLNGQRGSPTAKEKVPHIQKVIYQKSRINEDTMVHYLLQILLNNERLILNKDFDPEKALEKEEWVTRAWDKDFLTCKIKATFNKASVPPPVKDSHLLDTMLKDLPRVETPVPDIAYGLGGDDLPETMTTVFAEAAQLSKMLYHIFLIVEAKTDDRPPAEAENQCIRGGAAMVRNRRDWNLIAEGKDPKDYPKIPSSSAKQSANTPIPSSASKSTITASTFGPDPNSWAFTLALSPQSSSMHVVSLETTPENVEFWHTTPIATYDLRYGFDDSTERFQRHISNVLDWGVGPRADEIFQQARRIAEQQSPDESFIMPARKKQKMDGSD